MTLEPVRNTTAVTHCRWHVPSSLVLLTPGVDQRRQGAGGGLQQRQIFGEPSELDGQQRPVLGSPAVVAEGGQEGGESGGVGGHAGRRPGGEAEGVEQGGPGRREHPRPGEGGAGPVQEADAVAGGHQPLGRGGPAPPAAEVLQEADGARLQRHLRPPRRHQRHAPPARRLPLRPVVPAGSVALATRRRRRGVAALEGSRRCELCGAAAARVRCGGCRLTYYCDVDHQKADWVSIHQKICQLLIPIRMPLPFLLSEKERKHGAEQLLKRQKYLIDLAYGTAQEFVLDGKHKEALPAALHALRFSTEVYGSDSLQLVPAYLLLAEASTGVGRFLEASRYLSQAEWIVLTTPDCSAAVQYKLHRGLGLFCAAKGNFEQALYHLANDIYVASSAFGLKSLEASGGYFHMANVFFRQNKRDIANSLYAEVTGIWRAFLLKSVEAQERVLKSRPEMSPFSGEEEVGEEPLTEAQRAEATRVLSAVLDVRERAPKQQPGETAGVLHALAMLYYLARDLPKAREAGMRALHLVKQLPQRESLETVGRLLTLINSCTE
ncbi:zinc finger MYND domain-containing protein 12 [Numenius arquata]|uniref:zinc finger MYND domain-containing protein 12 n=1 Tax=Numenius arquata TaxID=31919 RepID=UPI003D305039